MSSHTFQYGLDCPSDDHNNPAYSDSDIPQFLYKWVTIVGKEYKVYFDPNDNEVQEVWTRLNGILTDITELYAVITEFSIEIEQKII